jgi:phage terminase large subunit
MIPASERDFILSRKDNKEWFRVYGLGQTGFYSDRQIYTYNFADIPADAKRIASGMDFGLSPDPTCLVDLYIKGADLYADERFQENNLMPEKIQGAERMAVVDKMEEIGFKKGWRIWGDSANKVNIIDLRKPGYNIFPVKKYTGSVIEGIKKVRSYNLYLTPRSTNIKKACESWFFKVDHNGKIIPEPNGHEPDTLAAIRYSVMMSGRVGFTI